MKLNSSCKAEELETGFVLPLFGGVGGFHWKFVAEHTSTILKPTIRSGPMLHLIDVKLVTNESVEVHASTVPVDWPNKNPLVPTSLLPCATAPLISSLHMDR